MSTERIPFHLSSTHYMCKGFSAKESIDAVNRMFENYEPVTKKEAKTIADDLISRGEIMAAVVVLTGIWPLETALAEVAPFPVASVGDILVSSWGYDQTNIDYYQVVKVTRASVKIRKLTTKITRLGQGQDTVIPGDAYKSDKVKTKRIQRHWSGVGYSVSIESFATAHLWDGEPNHQTSSGYGH